MSRGATLSIMGLYEYDPTVFDLLQLPEGLTAQTLIQNLCAETAELEILYPNATVMKNLIGAWSSKQLPVWTQLLSTTQYEYNPIENYNRYEEWTDTDSENEMRAGTHHTANTGTDSGYTNHQIAGFNSNALVDQSKDINSLTHGAIQDGTANDTVSTSKTGEHDAHIHGNIGVMSTQDMIKQEREVAEFNLYDIIIEEFKTRFCVLVY